VRSAYVERVGATSETQRGHGINGWHKAEWAAVRGCRRRIPGPTSRAPAASEPRGGDGRCSLASAPPSESGWVAAAATTPGALPGAGPTVPPAAPAGFVRCRLGVGCEAAQKGRVESTAEPKATSHERPQHSVRETRQRIPGPTSRAPAASAGPRGVDGSCSLASAPPSESGWVAAAATTPGALPGAGPTVPPAAPARAAWKQRGGGSATKYLQSELGSRAYLYAGRAGHSRAGTEIPNATHLGQVCSCNLGNGSGHSLEDPHVLALMLVLSRQGCLCRRVLGIIKLRLIHVPTATLRPLPQLLHVARPALLKRVQELLVLRGVVRKRRCRLPDLHACVYQVVETMKRPCVPSWRQDFLIHTPVSPYCR
jgi:hypothetical protein